MTTQGAPTTRFLDYIGSESTLRSTDEILAVTLPLLEQVLAVHERGKVAPLEGVDDVWLSEGKLWFEHGKAQLPRLAESALRSVEKAESLAFDVAGHFKRVDDDGGTSTANLGIVEPGTQLERPCFLTRYVSWEHEVGHHDPLSDIYVLGLVMASVALDQSLGDAETLALFVQSRSHLAGRNNRLHPVVARAIVRMTEVERHKRVQDLRSLIVTLRNYREQSLGLDDPAFFNVSAAHVSEPSSATTQLASRNALRKHVYGSLRDRLFDFSRRNRLLHFAPSGQTVNLTVASVPLVLDVKHIAPDMLLTWHGRAAEEITSTKPVPLGRYLRFEDYPYLSGALDQLRLDAKRNKTELGFSSLRLAVCFLQWHNLKEAKDVRMTSPLLLLPVTLEKKKGVRDAVLLTAESDHAEVNPVLRQYLAQLYGVRLPDDVDLSDPAAIQTLCADLVRQIQASEPGVTVTRVDKPRIDMILAQAKKRVEAYRKRVSLSGRSARSHRGFDYSYARSKFHPLGVQLFTHLVYPSAAPNRELHEEPRPRIFQHSPEVVEKSMVALKDSGAGGGPYEWALDLCNVTLANFNYRKMSLVRDYSGLIESDERHGSFDALFSDDPRPVADELPVIPVEERFDVMPADPTQLSAVARARQGACFIIQGPPGTGKSQTITNLVADYVARGKRVLFVCEKRAAIDVVYHRLRKQGLAPLTCLIHDSQADKKGFIKDLKETYEDWITCPATPAAEKARSKSVSAYGAILARAGRFRSVMLACPQGSSLSILSLLSRTLELSDVPASGVAPVQLPSHRELMLGAPMVRSLEQGLRALGRDPHFAQHPLRVLSDEILRAEDPVSLAREEGRTLLDRLDKLLNSQIGRVGTLATVGQLVERIGFIQVIRPLIAEKALRLLDRTGASRRTFDTLMAQIAELTAVAKKAVASAAGWRRPIAADEVVTALALARRFDGSFLYRLFGWLSPTWWRLRALLNVSFDFASKSLRPTWSAILETLHTRYVAEAAVDEAKERGQRELRVNDIDAVGRVLQSLPEVSPPVAEQFQSWLVTHDGVASSAGLLQMADASLDLPVRVTRLVRAPDSCSPENLRDFLADLDVSLGDIAGLLEPLRRLASPENATLGTLLREVPVTIDQIERDVCRMEVDIGLKQHARDTLSGLDWDALRDEAIVASTHLRLANAGAVVERARNVFLENVRMSSTPNMSNDTRPSVEKKQSRDYAVGRKELEHEFAKVTRYRSIRDLATAKSGVVLRDLKPVWLMSPLSVADTLPLQAIFDVVIFDEASQIPLEDAVPAAHRAAQTIIVGDEMQLPPTDFFGTSRRDSDGEGDDDRADDAGYELDAHSLLNHAGRTLPSTMLGWHYRSRDEALISFSNRVFYGGKLLTVPSVSRTATLLPILVKGADDGGQGASALLERSISFHHVEGSPYEQRRNTGEARYIAELLRGLLGANSGKTMGVVAFSEAQQGEIEAAVRDLAEEDAQFGAQVEAEMEREEDGQHVGLFVKNLENVQGDERDIIIISVCYGPDANGRMLMNFGPINKMGGEKRLNVIFSRAKHHVAVVSSIRWTAITNQYNDGANCLRNYLRYAEAMSTGTTAEAAAALQGYGKAEGAIRGANAGTLEERLADALRKRGYEVDVGVGTSQFRCNLGVRVHGEDRYRLGLLIDDVEHQDRAIEELISVQSAVLQGFGWKTLTVLHKDWYSDSTLVLQRIETAMVAGQEDIKA